MSDLDPNLSPMPGLTDGWSDFAAALLLSVEEAVLVVDAGGRVRSVNAPACEMFGIATFPPAPGDVIGQTVLEATHLRALAELCRAAQSVGERREEDIRLVGGRAERTVRARAVPFQKESSGASEGFATLLVLADQTELARLRTVRTEFVANVSHELRTPLASIRAMAETLQGGALDDPIAGPRFLETIIREANRLVRLSEDLLDLTRAESMDRDRTRFDLRLLIRNVAARLVTQAERRTIRFNLPPADGPVVSVDADQSEIDQVFFNLIDNAIKYTPPGGAVTVTITPNLPLQTVAVTVSDSGIGILSQDLPRIFERFWRADRARRFQSSALGEGSGGGTGGTGLGLSIVKHIVEAHGGVVTAESELGEGSRFTVTLPLPQISESDNGVTAASEGSQRSDSAAGPN
ncbi:MAG: PAS domain-containing protein [Cytophagales bacterium]|nr:PAS domain-containing protein [Armatimonadota bacterium]